jgi:pimeloyl-ACP methyl ester carboxylesterase
LSWGAANAPLPLALDDRFKTAVLVSGGLLWMNVRPEVDAVNFLPRVRIPILMLNGAHDAFYTPPAQRAFFDLLGTPAAQKKKVTYGDSGHTIPRNAGIAETLRWLDMHLGQVKRRN